MALFHFRIRFQPKPTSSLILLATRTPKPFVAFLGLPSLMPCLSGKILTQKVDTFRRSDFI